MPVLHKYNKVIGIVIDSGMVYLATQIIHVIFMLTHPSRVAIFGTLASLATAASLTPTVLIAYVALGKSASDSVTLVETLRFEAAERNSAYSGNIGKLTLHDAFVRSVHHPELGKIEGSIFSPRQNTLRMSQPPIFAPLAGSLKHIQAGRFPATTSSVTVRYMTSKLVYTACKTEANPQPDNLGIC
ncbi:hypothetical protein L218DRAFT_949726 [Marasmius fiardii PR-910]|nr:hypothetical protein L218DRAFT_949726 [Marasmius fiardii PR-910]